MKASHAYQLHIRYTNLIIVYMFMCTIQKQQNRRDPKHSSG